MIKTVNYGSVSELVDHARQVMEGDKNSNAQRHLASVGLYDNPLSDFFTGGKCQNFGEAMAMFACPSPDYAEFEAAIPDCGITRRMAARRRRLREEGDELDVSAYCSADYEHMFEVIEREACGRPIVDIVLDFNPSCKWKAGDFRRYTGVVAACVRVCEHAGINVAVRMGMAFKPYFLRGQQNAQDFNVFVSIKRADEYLDFNKLIFCAGDQLFYRTITTPVKVDLAFRESKRKLANGTFYCRTVDRSACRGSFVISWKDIEGDEAAKEVIGKFTSFISKGENDEN